MKRARFDVGVQIHRPRRRGRATVQGRAGQMRCAGREGEWRLFRGEVGQLGLGEEEGREEDGGCVARGRGGSSRVG